MNMAEADVADSAGRLIDANDAFLEMVGFSRGALERGALDLLSITAQEARARTAASRWAPTRRCGWRRCRPMARAAASSATARRQSGNP